MYLAMFYLLNMTHTRLYMCYIVTEEYHTYTMLDNVAQVGSLYFPPAQGFRTLTCGELYTSHLSKVKYYNFTFAQVKVLVKKLTLTCMEVYTFHLCKVLVKK